MLEENNETITSSKNIMSVDEQIQKNKQDRLKK